MDNMINITTGHNKKVNFNYETNGKACNCGNKSNCSLSNSDYFTSAKKCRRKSFIINFTLAKMEFMSAIFKKMYFSKYSIKR